MTNYERIKNMSVEEMVEFICSIYDENEMPYTADKNIEGDTILDYFEEKYLQLLNSTNLYDIGFDCCFSAIQDLISDVPVTDVVEVVRCKDCKHRDDGDCWLIELTKLDDYRSYGERQINDDD